MKYKDSQESFVTEHGEPDPAQDTEYRHGPYPAAPYRLRRSARQLIIQAQIRQNPKMPPPARACAPRAPRQ